MKIVIFDDDPTGSQTVYGCNLLFQWDQNTLKEELKNPSQLLFLLTNTRSLPSNLVEKRVRHVCRQLKQVINKSSINWEDIIFVSRGDSTLRGYGVLEPKLINEELGPFDATFHVPAFFEGGRNTIDGTHFLNGIPVHQTAYAKDRLFGYSTSKLADWLQEKSNGQIKASSVSLIGIQQLENASKSKEGMNTLIDYLLQLSGNKFVVVDATSSDHLDSFSFAIKSLLKRKRFLFRSAASLINSLSCIHSKYNPINDFSRLSLKDKSGISFPGLVVVGSHVKLADDQLSCLLAQESCLGLELNVSKLLKILNRDMQEEISILELNYVQEIRDILALNKTPVLYTSRGEISFETNIKRMEFGIILARLMARLACKFSDKIGYIISKGGITTHILLSEGLKLKSVCLKGQILPGLSVVCSNDNDKEQLPVITFPGNLGDRTTLVQVWKMMEMR
ncbi:four-carbon acid sugar kinase family protein [Prochlorococcus marinus]|uniref:four-carbon acid sugar kinase family protein n=1 Tax=Prochlorococcus marinus TaxID=1219 RepID=UPI0022B2C8E8|nr:four-carbon acid sugar kinase family protein [Prochlorococcus marinus]